MVETKFRVTVKHGEKNIEIETGSSGTILDFLNIHDFHMDAPCGGKGTCGKCKVKVIKGNDSELQEPELKFLTKKEIESGYRLACQTKITSDMVLEISDPEQHIQIESAHDGYAGNINPLVKKKYLQLPRPSLEDQRDDVSRITETLGIKKAGVSLKLRRAIPGILREADYSVTAIYTEDTLIGVESGNTETENYGFAVDIGTTTVVGHLLNMNTGEIIDTVSALNRQKTLGADVISRIEYCMREDNGLEILSKKIFTQMGEMALSVLERNSIKKEHIYSAMIAGNTTMLHLFYGIDPTGIAAAPFIPGTLESVSYSSEEIGDSLLNLTVYSLPSISAYIGADITAGILATRMHETEELSLLIDIGTNGEIVLGNKNKLYCCSTAAGPAFEGAHITCGMGGISGAIDTISLENGRIKYTTIGGTKPIGICGSGIIDTVAVLLKSGVVDFTGRIIEEDEAESENAKELIKKHFSKEDSGSFILTEPNIVFTQKDIREVQLAKAAISAGVATLLNEAGKTVNDVKHLYIAGGFGSYISKESAAAIGLIPADLLDRTESVGNTSGKGAAECSFSKENYNACDEIIKLTEYIELSSNTYFQGKYMEDMIFPEY